MPFHLLAYTASHAFGVTNDDTAAAVDPSFSIRNNHFIFTEPYGLAAAWALEANLTACRISTPSINAIAPAHIYPFSRAATPPTPLNLLDLRDYPMSIPQNEEVAVQQSNNLGAASEQGYAGLAIVPQGWNLNLPQGIRRLLLRATSSPTAVANAWSADAAITFEQSPKGGWYYLVGLFAVASTGIFLRVNFPRMPLIAGRKLFPGVPVAQALSDVHHLYPEDGMGVFGKFHTFEPPLIAVLGNTAGALTTTLFLDVIYMGEQEPNFQGL